MSNLGRRNSPLAAMAIPPKAWDIYIDRVMERVSAMDVAEWLQKLGLEQYEAAFRANEIDERVLPRLTAEAQGITVGWASRPRLLARSPRSAPMCRPAWEEHHRRQPTPSDDS
jgi:hypothetical protein